MKILPCVLSALVLTSEVEAQKPFTASPQVQVVDTAFYMPQLQRTRRIWIYLPKNYTQTTTSYPVLYMHDGQNLFNEQTSAFGEWGVDKAIDTLGLMHGSMIVVGIDNSPTKRLNEYSPYDTDKFGKAEGQQYLDFIVKTLKPYIDKHYRTKTRAGSTFIAGSSMGGLISFYAAIMYPKVFGAAGVFSPSFWLTPQLESKEKKQLKKYKGKIYFYAGQQESDGMVPDMLKVFEGMRRISKAHLEVAVRAEGKHNEASWRKEFPTFYTWLLR